MKVKKLMKGLLLISFIIGIVYFYYNIYDGTISHLSKVNNKMYNVRNSPDKDFKANLLGTLDDKLSIVVYSLSKEQVQPHNVKRLINNWNSGIKIKEIGNMESDAAYVINKKYMSFCLKDFKTISVEILDSKFRQLVVNNNFSFTLEIHEVMDVLKETLINSKTNNVNSTGNFI
jgi:hypothetical protein